MSTDGTGPPGLPPRRADVVVDGAGPRAASARRYLRAGLPAIYQDNDFGMRFVAALETLVDPVVSLLDAVHHHFDPDLAPRDVLALLSAWLGVELEETWPEEKARDFVHQASELARRRGTKAGLEQALRIAFPGLPLRVEDQGGVVVANDVSELPPAPAPQFIVYCDEPIDQPAVLARMIEYMKPVHVGYRLRIRTRKPPQG
ncbi:MAG: phage tail protein [Actinomycetota bacterium]